MGLVSALVLAVAGWLVVDGITESTQQTVESAAEVVEDVSSATDAAMAAIASSRRVIIEIENAARSSGTALATVEDLLSEVGDAVGGDIANSIESTVDAMPGLIQTGRVVDRTLRALTLVGVDYDPDVPLDEALEDLQASLAPMPEEIRSQAELVGVAAGDLSRIAQDARTLAAGLLDIRVELIRAEQLVAIASRDVEQAAASFRALAVDVETYGTWAPWLPVAAAIAIGAGSSGVLLIGLERRR